MLLTLRELPDQIWEHEDSEGEVVERGQSLGQALIVSGQTAETGGPRRIRNLIILGECSSGP
jgi:hypothetical protein